MHRRTVLVAAALTAFGGTPRAAGLMTDWQGPPAAPPIDLYTPGDDLFTLSSLLGKVVLVNFWATWCEPCVTEMPSLQRVRDRFAPDFEVLGVNYQEGPARIKTFIDKTSITFPIVRDTDGAVAKAWGARIFPASYLVDRAGRVKHVLIGGADWTSPKLLSTIQALL
jgi:thiol-disulfide isomerase/thioredoxin